MKKAALIVGARPQFIKIAPLLAELRRFYKIILVHTGQHFDFDMSGLFFGQLDIPEPDYHLNSASGSDARQTSRMIAGLESVLKFENPDFSLVIGDTNSTLAGALVSARLEIPVVHIEAGVRSRNKYLPEQINRVVTDSVSECYLCPTPSAVKNLEKEGRTENVYDTGDVIYDCLRIHMTRIPSGLPPGIELPDKFVLATLHRAEAVDIQDNLRHILRSLGTTTLPVILPLHPRTRKMIDRYDLRGLVPSNVHIINPLGYLDLLFLLKSCQFVVSDSGGVQRESAFLGKRVVVPRPETEWIDLVEAGWVRVAGYEFRLDDRLEAVPERSLGELFRSATDAMIKAIRKHY